MKLTSKKLAGLALGSALAFIFMGCPGQVEKHEHTYSEDWSNDDTHHWHAATCEHSAEFDGMELHTYDDWSLIEEEDSMLKTCNKCGYIAGRGDIYYEGECKIIIEYDDNDNIDKKTKYNDDGSVDFVEEYDDREQLVNFTKYNADGSVCIQYKAAEGNYIDVDIFGSLVDRILEYNSNDNLVKTTYYRPDGTVVYFEEYSSNNVLYKATSYNEDGSVNYIDEYDGNGNPVKTTYYFPDGQVNYIQEYSSIGMIAKYTQYNTDGILELVEEYDSDGRMIKSTKYNAEGTPELVEEYDDNGNQVKYAKYNSDGSVCIEYQAADGNYITVSTVMINYVFGVRFDEYNSNRNLIKETTYTNDGSLKEIVEFDDDYTLLKQIRYKDDGSWYVYEHDTVKRVNRNTYYNPDGSIEKVEELPFYS